MTPNADTGASADIDGHTRLGGLLVHRPRGDGMRPLSDEPGHQALCHVEPCIGLRAIAPTRDLGRHMVDAVRSLAICLAADESIRTGRIIEVQGQGPGPERRRPGAHPGPWSHVSMRDRARVRILSGSAQKR